MKVQSEPQWFNLDVKNIFWYWKGIKDISTCDYAWSNVKTKFDKIAPILNHSCFGKELRGEFAFEEIKNTLTEEKILANYEAVILKFFLEKRLLT